MSGKVRLIFQAGNLKAFYYWVRTRTRKHLLLFCIEDFFTYRTHVKIIYICIYTCVSRTRKTKYIKAITLM